MNVVFDDEYTLYLTGMEWLLMDLFGRTEDIYFSEMDSDTITQVDIIVKSFSAGERFLCQPMMKMRQQGSLVIGIYDGSTAPTCAGLPLCFSNTVFINRSESLDKIKELVFLGMQRSLLETQQPSKQNCLMCKHQTLTLQQAGVATRFYLGEETHAIARKMKISAKTVSSHKYVIMKKFNLGTDQDLLTLLNLLKSQLISPNIFREYLNLCC
ncbi:MULTISPECIES: LuxR C-terminal-related transcriptional regulator [unclassified Serratia (in: enterobacteria)]|uniref:helix-turn-helix transcriptional regulator n=1 Tax=unclassified Serratia (in: enterobacteria) TaxID=2647522 RepID=UPI0004684802|nr:MULTISPECIES: LuxR C-terminal-related transcriptional regulator [unclassified Serratia (in: enterobacteria)]